MQNRAKELEQRIGVLNKEISDIETRLYATDKSFAGVCFIDEKELRSRK